MNSVQSLHGNYSIVSQLSGYFQIVPSSLIPIIYKNQSQIMVTHGSTLIFNAGGDSVDPNEPPGSFPVKKQLCFFLHQYKFLL